MTVTPGPDASLEAQVRWLRQQVEDLRAADKALGADLASLEGELHEAVSSLQARLRAEQTARIREASTASRLQWEGVPLLITGILAGAAANLVR